MLNLIIYKKKEIPAQAQLPRTTLIQHYGSYLTTLSAVQPTNIKWISLKLRYTRNLQKHLYPKIEHFNVIKTTVSFHSIVNGHKVSPLVVKKEEGQMLGLPTKKCVLLKHMARRHHPPLCLKIPET